MMKNSLVTRAALVATLAASLGACASQRIGGGDTVSRNSVGAVNEVDYGTVVDARPVTIQGTRSGTGAVVGAVAGGVAGSSIGGGDRAHILGGVAGAVVGGLVGDAVEEGATQQRGMEYTVRLERGNTFTVTQGPDYDIRRGDRVQVIYERNGRVRIVPAGRY